MHSRFFGRGKYFTVFCLGVKILIQRNVFVEIEKLRNKECKFVQLVCKLFVELQPSPSRHVIPLVNGPLLHPQARDLDQKCQHRVEKSMLPTVRKACILSKYRRFFYHFGLLS